MVVEQKEIDWLRTIKYGGKESEAFFSDLRRLQNGEPLPYILGHVPFLEATIYLDSCPLIPRAETEFWVSEALREIDATFKNAEKAPHILDLCAGSGCIGVATLLELLYAHVDFAEIDTVHHTTILKNLSENGVNDRGSHIFGGNLFEQVQETYDVIFTNPPYIDPALDRTEESVRAHEPHTALYGGDRGMEFIIEILTKAPTYLNEEGVLYIEHEPEQTTEIQTIGKEFWQSIETRKDQYGRDRYTRLARNTKNLVSE